MANLLSCFSSFAERNLGELRAAIEREISLSFPGYKIFIVIDREFA